MACDRTTKQCDVMGNANRKKEHTPECCREHFTKMLLEITGIFTTAGLIHWVDWGSLLGIIRSGELIPWDRDIDFGIWAKDLPKLHALEPVIRERGYDYSRYNSTGFNSRKIDTLTPRIYFSKTNRLFADIYLWEIARDGVNAKMVKYNPTFPCHKKYYADIIPHTWKNHTIRIPNYVEDYLAVRFGDHWRVPNISTLL